MAEKKLFPGTLSAIEIEAMKELQANFTDARLKVINATITEVFQEDDPTIPPNGDLPARIIFTGTFEVNKLVKKRDPWWVG